MENGAKEIFQYYAIRNNQEQLHQRGDNGSVVYLTVNQDDDIITSVVTADSSDSENNVVENNSTALGNNVQIITLDDGRMFLTAPSEEENFESVEPHLITSEAGSSNEENVEDRSEENSNDTDYEIVHVIDDSQQMYLYCDVDAPQEQIEEKTSFACLHQGCDKIFSDANGLNTHVRSHLDSKPYLCTEEGCGKAFSTSYSLKAHIRTHTGEKPYGCVVCEKSFKTSGDLQKHHRIHTGEKPFMCPIEGCGKSFTTSNIRKVHIRSHTGERPYTCSYPGCGKAFSSSTNHKNHIRIHSGEKPYVCNYKGCGKRFTEYSSLYKHNPVHQSDRPFQCVFCKKTFKQEYALRYHKRLKHNVIIASDGTEIIVDMDM